MLSPLIAAVIGYALPPRCPGCGAVTEADHRFCARCWAGLTFLAPPWCARCSAPFDHDRGAEALCGRCLAGPAPYGGPRAAVAYGEVASRVALRLKYGGRTAFATTVAQAMARLMPADAELLVPVPLHRWRIWTRGYNQAALIAGELARLSDVGHAADALTRVRATPSLGHMNPAERRRALAGSIAAGRGIGRVRERHVVLVDDVHTSGATAGTCTRVLRAAGAGQVTVLCWARVLGAEGD